MVEGTYKKIMVATDGSQLVKKAVNMAIEISRLSGAKLYAVYVILPATHSARDFGWEKAATEHFRNEGERATLFVKEAAEAAGVEVEPVMLEGHPADKIMEFAEQNGIEMIVMGTLGKTGLDRFLLGSVAENVVRHSKIPVLVVRGEVQE
ncbi:universal stress protein [Methanosarcina sp. DH2]|jgi:nucleotide-binding universal stress UspA family protein|uniref:universal stress protein n=1 Tax=Methanosarcina sp. DH2 TaxID=2605639 RepID=UPI001E4B33A1|nr:universal stress protein [Methanosarcina sp. DH2]MCC4768663.1 universal stress protein [Methanosarcina sp. DH2]